MKHPRTNSRSGRLLRLPSLLLYFSCTSVAAQVDSSCNRDAFSCFPERFVLGEVKIDFESEGCYGGCEKYHISISGDGSVNFVGTEFVDSLGEWSLNIAPDSVLSLLDVFLRTHFCEMNDKYRIWQTFVFDPDRATHSWRSLEKTYSPQDTIRCASSFATDQLTRRFTLTVGAMSKTVVDYLGAPEALELIKSEILRIAGLRSYVNYSKSGRK